MKRLFAALLSLATLALTQNAFACFLNQGGCSPEGLAFDATGNLWAAFYDTNSVVNLGVPDVNALPAAAVTVIQQGLNGPTRIAFFGQSLYVTNSTGNTVTLYNSLTASKPTSTVTGVQRPLGIAIDASGNFFVADNQSSAISGFGAPLTNLGEETVDANGHSFYAPGALAINGASLYVATGDGVVHAYPEQRFLLALEILAQYHNPETSLLTETATFSDPASGGPTGIAFDPQGNIYISYYYSSDVVKYSPSGQKLMTISAGVSHPEGIAVQSSTGYIYVANTTEDGFITVYEPNGTQIGALFNLDFE